MPDTTNIVQASFGDQRTTTTRSLYQWDYGQILQFEDIELPSAYEVHFSNIPYSGETTTQIGDADGVNIPDAYLLDPGYVYAWVYLHTGEDDGETRYLARIPVTARSKPTNQQPTPVQQDAITEAIAALQAADGVAETFAHKSEAWAVGEVNGVPVSEDDETFRNNAKFYAELAENSLCESGYIAGYLNANGELVIEIVNLEGVDIDVQDEEVVVIYE